MLQPFCRNLWHIKGVEIYLPSGMASDFVQRVVSIKVRKFVLIFKLENFKSKIWFDRLRDTVILSFFILLIESMIHERDSIF